MLRTNHKWTAALSLLALTVTLGAAAEPRPATLSGPAFEEALARQFQYGPPKPLPPTLTDHAAGQRADAAYLQPFLSYDRSFPPSRRRQAKALLTQLDRDAGALTREAFILRVAEILALADNAHTAVNQNAWMKNTPRIPLRLYPFADGLFVVRANPANSDLLGLQVTAIDGMPIGDVVRRLSRYSGGTADHRLGQIIPLLESPMFLTAAGVGTAAHAVIASGRLPSGATVTRRIEAEDRDAAAPVSGTARLLFPAPAKAALQGMPGSAAAVPLALRQSDRLFRADNLPGDGRYVAVDFNNDTDDQPLTAFLDAQLKQVTTEHPAYFVLDLRLNGGGDYTKSYAFARALPAAMQGHPIYLLTSRWTFSAAITTAAALKDAGGRQVTIVGEPVGDRLDFWGETGVYRLPNVDLIAFYATGRHTYNGPCRDPNCFWLNERYPVRVRTLAPDIAAPLTFAAYAAGRDPAMEAVFARQHIR